MTVPTTWTELKAQIAALSVRDDTDDPAYQQIASFIGYAENWFQRELFSPEREETVTLTVTNGVASLPSDFGGVKMVYVDGSTDTVLVQTTPAELRAKYPTATTGTPAFFAIEGETMLFGPIPSSLTIKLKYIEGITPLGESNASNWLLAGHPDLYVNAAMAELYEMTRDYDAANRRRSLAVANLESVNRSSRRRKGNSGALRATSPVAQVSRWARA